MPRKDFRTIVHKLRVGRRLRCPVCEQGKLFRKGFIMNETCAYCGARFERAPGESVGAMYLTEGLTSVLAIIGYFVVDGLFHPPFVPHLLAWVTFVVLFSLWAYRPSRGMWVSIVYLTGGVYPDADHEHEYVAPEAVRRRDARRT